MSLVFSKCPRGYSEAPSQKKKRDEHNSRYFLFSPLFQEDVHFDYYILQWVETTRRDGIQFLWSRSPGLSRLAEGDHQSPRRREATQLRNGQRCVVFVFVQDWKNSFNSLRMCDNILLLNKHGRFVATVHFKIFEDVLCYNILNCCYNIL